MCKIIYANVQRKCKEAAIKTEKKTCITTARQLIAYGETDIEKIAKCCSLGWRSKGAYGGALRMNTAY